MQRVFSFRDAYGFFKSQCEKNLLRGESFVLGGKEGTGKSHVIDHLEQLVKKAGSGVYRSRSFSSSEALMYQVYNDLLNQLYGEFKERTLPEIVEAFTALDNSKINGSLFVIDGLENMMQNPRDLFIYIARVASRKGFILIGTITDDYVDDEKSIVRFLNLVESEQFIHIISFEKANLEDIKFMLNIEKYNLPSSFVQELYRLTNGNIRSLRYTLNYYRDQGIINERNSLEEVTYRYFPIPPSTEIRFEQIIKGLNKNEKAILEVVSLIQEDLSPGFISELTQMKRVDVIEALEKLTGLGIVSRLNLNYSITNSRMSEIVLDLVYSSAGYIISDSFISQPTFKKLPFITKLKTYELRKDASSIEELVNSDWRPFLDRISYIAFSRDLFRNLQKIVKGKEAKAHLALMVAQSLLNVGDHDGAMEIYTSPEVAEVEPVFTKLSEAKLLQKLDQLKNSIDKCKKILEMENLTPYDRTSAMILLAVNYSFSSMLEEGLKIGHEAISMAMENTFEDLMADAYGTLGTLMVKKFDLKSALEYYGKSMKLSQKNKFFDRELLMLNNIAIIHSYWGQFEKAAQMLIEIIEKSYISGELLSRAYATYNLSEIYYDIDKVEEFRSYLPSAAGLVRLVGEGNLSYPFFRFASQVSLDFFSFGSAIKYTEELLKVTKSFGNKERENIARGLYILAQQKLSKSLTEELESLFLIDMEEVDDFLPVWYLFAGVHFCLTGDIKKANEVFEKQRRASEIMGDSHGDFIAKIGKTFQLLINGDNDTLAELVKEGYSIGEFKNAYPRFQSMFENYLKDKKSAQKDAAELETYFNLAAAILMGLKPGNVERGELDNFNYFQKCRSELSKGVVPL